MQRAKQNQMLYLECHLEIHVFTTSMRILVNIVFTNTSDAGLLKSLLYFDFVSINLPYKSHLSNNSR